MILYILLIVAIVVAFKRLMTLADTHKEELEPEELGTIVEEDIITQRKFIDENSEATSLWVVSVIFIVVANAAALLRFLLKLENKPKEEKVET